MKSDIVIEDGAVNSHTVSKKKRRDDDCFGDDEFRGEFDFAPKPRVWLGCEHPMPLGVCWDAPIGLRGGKKLCYMHSFSLDKFPNKL